MPTYTTNYDIPKPLVNDPTDQDLWGGELNDGMDIIDTTLKAISDATLPVTRPKVSVYLNANQTINSGTATKILFDTESFDTNNNFASNRFTPTVAGYYFVSSNVVWGTTNSTYTYTLYIYKNGVAYKVKANASLYIASASFQHDISDIVYLNGSTDYIEIYGKQDSGSARIVGGVTGGAPQSWFLASLLM